MERLPPFLFLVSGLIFRGLGVHRNSLSGAFRQRGQTGVDLGLNGSLVDQDCALVANSIVRQARSTQASACLLKGLGAPSSS
jgi:hypothetical protein